MKDLAVYKYRGCFCTSCRAAYHRVFSLYNNPLSKLLPFR